MKKEHTPHRGFLAAIFGMKCPRCREGDMFVHKNPYKKAKLDYMLEMPTHCRVCRQKFELETGFWYGTGYVSYGLAVAFSVVSFMAWWLIIGFSLYDNRIFYWLVFNGILVVVLQPWLMRISRVLYLYFFVPYNENYASEDPVKLG